MTKDKPVVGKEPVGVIADRNGGHNTASLPPTPMPIWFGSIPPIGTPLYTLTEAELSRLSDDPDMDATDGAHPAWWRGNDSGVETTVQIVNDILDGKPRGVFGFDGLNKLCARLSDDGQATAGVVKPLEWHNFGSAEYAGEPPLRYTIVDMPYGFVLKLGDLAIPERGISHSSYETAKAAAQADYEQRILSALSPAPSRADTAGVVTDEMVEAAARALCRFGTSFPTIEQTLDWVDLKWIRFTGEARAALEAALSPRLSQHRCPIGLDKTPELCSAGSCPTCMGKRLSQLVSENERLREGLTEIARPTRDNSVEHARQIARALLSNPEQPR